MLKPESVDDYNHCMNGVDHSAVFCVVSFCEKNLQVVEETVLYLVNSFILYHEVTQKKTAHLDFRLSLVESLVTEYLEQQESRHSFIGRPLSWPRPVHLDRKLHLLEQGETGLCSL